MRIEVSQTSSADPARLFELLCDLRWFEKTVSGVTRLEVVQGAADGSPFGVGVRWRETRVICGSESTETMEVTAYDPDRRAYTVSSYSCGCDYTSVVRVDEHPDGARMVMTMDSVPRTCLAIVFSWIMSYFMTGTMVSMVKKDLVEIRAAAEAC